MKRMRLLWLLASLMTFGTGQAQHYLVTTGKDTLRGKVTISTFKGNDRAVLVVDKKKTELPAYRVLSIHIDSNLFVPVRTPEAFQFMLLKKSGMVSLCLARQSPGTPYNVPYLVKVSGESMEVNALRFKKTLSRFLSECNSLIQRIESDSLGRNDLDKIVDIYNRCLVQQTTVAFIPTEDPKLSAISDFNKKLESDTTVPGEAREILKDLYAKVKEGKPAPNYLTEGLRESLRAHPAYTDALNQLLETLKR